MSRPTQPAPRGDDLAPLPGVDTDRAVDAAMLDVGIARSRVGLAITTVSLVTMGPFMWPFFPHGSLLAWAALLLTVAAGRSALGRANAFAADAPPRTAVTPRRFTVGAAAGGASWAFGACLLMPGPGRAETLLLLVMLLAVAAVATSSLATQLRAMRAFIAAALLPTAAALFATGGSAERAASAMLVVITLVLMLVGRRSNLLTRQAFTAEQQLCAAMAATDAARRRAEAASAAKTLFLANMSHELRTPLNAVIGAAQLMKSCGSDAEQREHLADAIQRSGTNLLGLIENILDMARIEAGELVLVRHDFHLADAIEAALSTAGLAARAKGLQLACIVDPALPAWRHGDSARLRQVLLNLLGNAVKFTPTGDIVVRVGAGHRADEVCISITDTGIGIDPAALAHVFEPFRQAEQGADRRFAGTGLGLAIVHQLVEAMGGHIGAASQPGAGACFTVTLPMPAAGEPPEATPALNQRVAYIEPHDACADAIHSLLVRMGCHAQRCHDAGALRAWLAAGADVPDRCWVLAASDAPEVHALLEQAADMLEPERLIGMSNTEFYDGERAREHCRLPRNVIKPVSRAALASRMVDAHVSVVPEPTQSPLTQAAADAAPRVLVVEDDALNRTIVCQLLRHSGCAVSAVADGQAALDLLNEQPFDLVLMDWQMPGMDGLEATRRLRAGAAGDAGRTVPVVALTANAFAEDRATCLAAGMNDFLTKPVLAGSLARMVDRWVTGAPPGGKGQQAAP
jgi:signal transduction histidine kinase/CheY-like chemotaxis protein